MVSMAADRNKEAEASMGNTIISLLEPSQGREIRPTIGKHRTQTQNGKQRLETRAHTRSLTRAKYPLKRLGSSGRRIKREAVVVDIGLDPCCCQGRNYQPDSGRSFDSNIDCVSIDGNTDSPTSNTQERNVRSDRRRHAIPVKRAQQ